MTEQEQRAMVATIALEWERTPYVHEGHIKGVCADCTFFMDVFAEAKLIEPFKLPHYSPQAHLNRQASMYIPVLERYTREITEEEAGIGDIVMFRVARTWSHGAMVIPPGFPYVVHADMAARRVIKALAGAGRLNHERRFFSFFGRGK